MSIIREDEANLDGAIWHMERAYEVQPFNPAVQDELRRLYGRRDGIEPPKIRLTRGALIRMYARGELYPQAIAETRAALAEDPQRHDLQVLLARLYFLNGQKVEAAEVCSSLIAKLPYCYEANLILSEVLPGTSRAEDARTFQQRLYALDPYAAFLSPSALTADLVPDQAVTVEQFMFDTELEQQDQRPDWTRNVGVDWQETEEEQLPDWLNTLPAQDQVAPPEQAAQPAASDVQEDAVPIEQPPQDDEGVPEWMRAAGWAKSDRSADEIAKEQLSLEALDRPGIEEEAAPAEIPDWLKTMAPAGDADQPADEQERLNLLDSILPGAQANETSAVQPAEEENLDWLTTAEAADTEGRGDVSGSDSTLETSTSMPEWLANQEETSGLSAPDEAERSQPAEEIPDWLAGLGSGSSAEPVASDTPDWLNSLGGDEALPQVPTQTEIIPEGAPDLLSSLSDQEAELSPSTSWMASSEDEKAAEQLPGLEDTHSNAESLVTEENLPDQLQSTETVLNVPAPPLTAEEITTPSADVSEIYASAVEEPTLAEDAQPAAPDFSDMDAAMAWLESLAAKQGADEATLTTRPEDRLDTPPDWIIQELATGEPEVAQLPEAQLPEELPAVLDQPSDTPQLEAEADFPDWLLSIDQQDETFQPSAQPGSSTTDWMAALEQETLPTDDSSELPSVSSDETTTVISQAAEESQAAAPDLSDMDAAMAWLESLAAKQGADEATLVTRPEDRLESPPDWAQQVDPQGSTQPVRVRTSDAESLTPEPAEIEPESDARKLPITIETPALQDSIGQEGQATDWLSEEILLEPAVEATAQPSEGNTFRQSIGRNGPSG
jgi:tetratricopeptide (TPR) repeat protein